MLPELRTRTHTMKVLLTGSENKGGERKTRKRWRAEEVQLQFLLLRAGHQLFLASYHPDV